MADRIVVTFLAGTRVDSFEQDRVTLGRSADNDLVVEHEVVSGHHAELVAKGGSVVVNDLGSTNGTFVAKKQVSSETMLKPNDVLRLGQGGPEMKVALKEEAGAAPADGTRVEQKKFIGEATLFRAIGTATKKTRSKMYAWFVVVILLVGAAATAGVYLYKDRERQIHDEQASIRKDQKEIEDDVADAKKGVAEAKKDAAEAKRVMAEVRATTDTALREELEAHKKELDALKGKVGEEEGRLAALMVEIQERDKALEAIRRRQDLSEEQRRELIAETEAKVKALAGELGRTEEKLRKAAAAGGGGSGGGATDWAGIVEKNQKSIFLIVSEWKEKRQQSIGTGFAIRGNGLLATNAHVVKQVLDADVNVAIQNVTGRVYAVKRATSHPGWTKINGPDVGLVEIDLQGASIPALEIASDDEVKKLRIGTQLGTIGYPGELHGNYLSNVDRERGIVKTALATFKDGWIGRITDYDGAAADPAGTRYIQHSASLSGGTSGSPMFTASGRVVAINHAGMDYFVKVKQPDAGGAGEVRTPSAAEIGYAIRADELRAFLKMSGW